MAFTPEYRSRIHEALLVIPRASVVGATTGFAVMANRELRQIVAKEDLKEVGDNLYNQLFVLEVVNLEPTEDTEETGDELQVYVKLGLFLAMLNSQLKSAETPYISFNLNPGDNRYKSIDGHVSVDPMVCLLPSTLDGILDKSDTSVTNPLIYDLYLNTTFVANTLDQYIDRTGNVMLLDFFESLFSEIERVTGGINKYELQYFENTSEFTILDRNYLEPTPRSSFPELSIYGVDSTVKSFNLTTKISSKLSSMIAIAAQDNPFTSNMESTGFNALNADLEQGISNEFKDGGTDTASTKLLDKASTYDQVLEDFETSMLGLKKHFNAIYGLKTLSLTDAYIASSTYQNYCNMLIGKKNEPEYAFIIPFELGLELHGVSGLNVLESFTINKNILPSTYGGDRGVDVAFVITGVEHQINKTGWFTKIKTQIYNVNSSGKINNGKDYQTYWQVTAVGSGIPNDKVPRLDGAYSTTSDNNPYNIRPIGSAINFNGVTGQKEGFRGSSSIGYFLVFDTLNNGVRAGMKNLVNGYFNNNINTINGIVNRYAPSSDSNDTESYIDGVAADMKAALSGTKYKNIDKNTVLSFSGADEKNTDNIKMFRELNKAILRKEGAPANAIALVDSFPIANLA